MLSWPGPVRVSVTWASSVRVGVQHLRGEQAVHPLRGGQAVSTLRSNFTGWWRPGSRLLIRMGVGRSRVARKTIAETKPLRHAGRPHRLIAVEVGRRGVSYGTPQGGATLVYNGRRHTLTVTVHARGITPGPHAAHIHLGSRMS